MGTPKRFRKISVGPAYPRLIISRSVDEVAAGGKIEIRGDAESVGFNETFLLRIQARLRKKSKITPVMKAEPKLSRRDLEKMYCLV
jgi:hypothetical protein